MQRPAPILFAPWRLVGPPLLVMLLGLAGLPQLGLAQSSPPSFPPINPAAVTIVRDAYGVPHIFAERDAEVAYGLAWAHAEDDFASIQGMLLMARGRSGEVNGVEGAQADYFRQLIEAPELSKEGLEACSQDFLAYLDGYVQGLNAYALAHPDQVKLKGLFPGTVEDVAQGYTIILAAMVGLADALQYAMKGKADQYIFNPGQGALGSNALALNAHRMADGKTRLLANPHVPYEGMAGFYEAHLYSQEGLNIHGVLFPGTPAIGIGFNDHLGWTMTFNWPKYVDIYELKPHPRHGRSYRYNGDWVRFEQEDAKLKVKLLGFLKLPAKKAIYRTVHGPALKTKHGFYAFRWPHRLPIRAGEQWYRMGKARSLQEFNNAMRMHEISLFNVIYADEKDNILYQFNGLLPDRADGYDWRTTLPGDTSAVVWTSYEPYDRLPRTLNPRCGYVYNTNNPPTHSTCEAENTPDSTLDPNWVMEWNRENHRDVRFREMMAAHGHGKLTEADLRRLKYDSYYPQQHTMAVHQLRDAVLALDTNRYRDLARAVRHIAQWDMGGQVGNRYAALPVMALTLLFERVGAGFVEIEGGFAPKEKDLVWALRTAKRRLLRHHGQLTVAWGTVQRHQRHNVDLPMDGLPETWRATYTHPTKRGRLKAYLGDTYIAFGTYTEDGLQRLESIMPYGSSTHPESPHHTDQMVPYTTHQTRVVPLNKADLLQQATRRYHPGGAALPLPAKGMAPTR